MESGYLGDGGKPESTADAVARDVGEDHRCAMGRAVLRCWLLEQGVCCGTRIAAISVQRAYSELHWPCFMPVVPRIVRKKKKYEPEANHQRYQRHVAIASTLGTNYRHDALIGDVVCDNSGWTVSCHNITQNMIHKIASLRHTPRFVTIGGHLHECH